MNAYVIEAKRTPIGRSHPEKGMYAQVRADDLLAGLLKHFAKHHVSSKEVEDVYAGCVGQHLEQGKNIARLSALIAGYPESVAGVTINRLCGSSLQAFNFAAATLHAAQADILMAGGVEHMHHVPMAAAIDYSKELLARYEFPFTQMGLTAEKVAEVYKVSRKEQDEFSLKSQQKAVSAIEQGFFKTEIVPVEIAGQILDRDQLPRSESSFEALQGLKTVFKENGTVTAGNSSPISDGASLTLLASERGCEKLGLKARAQVMASAVIGLDPCQMGMGPLFAIKKLLTNNKLKLQDIDLFEINEAFASQAIACVRELQISESKVNVFGGGIALGHPLGCTGTRLIATMLNALERQNKEFGVASMCIGHGQGIATLIRRVR